MPLAHVSGKGKDFGGPQAPARRSTRRIPAGGFVGKPRTGRWKLPHRSMVSVTPFSAPFSGFCLRLGSLCKGRDGWMVIAGFRDGPSRRTMPTHPPFPAPLCAAQARPARRSWLKRKGRSDARSLPPCRRRETIFRRPPWRRLTSFPHHRRRPRLAATPCSVSVAGWGDCRHEFGRRGKCWADFLGRGVFPCGWILGSSPRMTEGRQDDGGEGG